MQHPTTPERAIRAMATSLHWDGGELVDPVGGFQRWTAAGVRSSGQAIGYGDLFDTLAVSPSGRYQALYTRRGTKALLLDGTNLVRELNRSYYQAEAYDYPIALGRLPDGREVVAHCPDEYNRLQIDDAATGKPLARMTGECGDYFHSRLQFSPDGRHLLVNGWFWHPEATVEVHDVLASLSDPGALGVNMLREGGGGDCGGQGDDGSECWQADPWRGEAAGACWLAADRIAVIEVPDGFEDGDAGAEFSGTTTLAVLTPHGEVLSRNPVEVNAGVLLACGDNVLNLHGHPTLLNPVTGRTVAAWPHLDAGNTDVSYGLDPTRLPAAAYHPERRELALAQGDRIVVLGLGSLG